MINTHLKRKLITSSELSDFNKLFIASGSLFISYFSLEVAAAKEFAEDLGMENVS